MKKIAIFFLFTILLLACNKDNNISEPANIILSPYVIENYTYDARQLYLDDLIHDSTNVNYYIPIIDDTEVENILKIIQAVYNLDSPYRDTVFDIYQIHGYYCYSFNSMSLNVQTDNPGIINLSNGIFPTGDTDLDNILTTYHFDSVRTAYSYPNFPWLSIFTKDKYNLIPLEETFENIGSILIAEFNKGCIGDGNTVTLNRDSSSATITFSIGSGDCPAGCIYYKYWEFEVINEKAKFIKTYEN